MLNMLALFWAGAAVLASAGEGFPTQQLVARCQGPEKEPFTKTEASSRELEAAEKALLATAPGLEVAGRKDARTGGTLFVAFELYRKDLPDQRYAVVGLFAGGPARPRLVRRTSAPLDLGFRHHLLGFFPDLGTDGAGLRVCRAWLGDPDHFYREWAVLLVPAPKKQLAVGLRTLTTESEKFGDDPSSVTLRRARLSMKKPKTLTKKLEGTELTATFRLKGGRYVLEGSDPLLPTPSDGP